MTIDRAISSGRPPPSGSGSDSQRRRGAVSYEVYCGRALLASTSDAATALVLAREWLREPQQAASGTYTCLVQIRCGDELVGEHIVALAARPLARPPDRAVPTEYPAGPPRPMIASRTTAA